VAINNLKEYIEAIWNWDCLKDCFGSGRIKPSDVDGMVERRGHFLYLEAKGIDVKLGRGQEICMEERVKDGVSTYIVIWGNPGVPEYMKVYYPVQMRVAPKMITCDLAALRAECKQWYRRAESINARDAMRQALGLA
jgi:hypothetical protein